MRIVRPTLLSRLSAHASKGCFGNVAPLSPRLQPSSRRLLSPSTAVIGTRRCTEAVIASAGVTSAYRPHAAVVRGSLFTSSRLEEHPPLEEGEETAITTLASSTADASSSHSIQPRNAGSSSIIVAPRSACNHTGVSFLPGKREPLSTFHPVFGQQQRVVRPSLRRKPISVAHPAFGCERPLSEPVSSFRGPVSVSGFFLAVDPTFAAGRKNRMNPNAQLTIRDHHGHWARARYRCVVESTGGLKVEALLRFQVGWVSPSVAFSTLPQVIHLGRGIDISLPFVFHFTMIAILDEHGCATGSTLYFSGTPMLGLAMGCSRITGGRLILDPVRAVDPAHEAAHHFIGHVHYRQLAFVAFKCLSWLLFTLACIPPVRRFIQAKLPNPLFWYSETSTLVQG